MAEETAVTQVPEQRWHKADVNVERARERLAAASKKGVKRDKIEGIEGKYKANYRRILPPVGNMDDWYLMGSTHFNVGPNNRVFLCPREMKFEDAYCPLCEAGFGLLKQPGNEDQGKEMLPRWRFTCNTVEVDKDGNLVDDQPRVLSLNGGQFDSLCDEFETEGDLTDVETGRNINFRAKKITKKVGNKDLSYNEIKFKLAAPSAFPGGNTDIINEAEDLTTLTDTLTSEQIAEAMVGGGGQAAASFGATPAVTEGTVTPALPPAAAAPPAPAAGGFGDDEDDEVADAEDAVAAAAPASTDEPNNVGAGHGSPTNPADAIARLEARKSEATGV